MFLGSAVVFLLASLVAASVHIDGKSQSVRVSSSSVVFPISGNAYPNGYYYVAINIGQPAKPYFLDIDTGSDITWLQCDAPCAKCQPAPHPPYKPSKSIILCQDPICTSLQGSGNLLCKAPKEQCDYEVSYADSGSSLGVLLKDYFPLRLTNARSVAPQLAFGCGYNQEVQDSSRLPYTDGVLGLGLGNTSILAQLSHLGIVKNVVSHCLSGHGQGFLTFGDEILPKSGITWISISSQSTHYSVGPADILLGGKATTIRGLPIVFDSGSTYTYFSSRAYGSLVSLMKANIDSKQLKDAPEDRTLPVCWKGGKPFKSVNDVATLFKPLTLSFTKVKNVQFQLPPQSYLIVTEHGNVCLGILNGGEVGLGNINLIGDISLVDKLVVYDNEKHRIGWAAANCDRLPKS
ncbi:hypothetical protein M569_02067 [Genlisea aurea]|uniref:Aspartic proteinase Asp1 n=1 Tax=Genlisea aurea TaxID=192259 RepID=S8E9X3_9LAMI|nr:hypothetical protein M569_02067 [Genlisea aurea]